MKPSSDLRFCSCANCRAGLHRSSKGHGEIIARKARRSFRRTVQNIFHKMLVTGNYEMDIPSRKSVPYTD